MEKYNNIKSNTSSLISPEKNYYFNNNNNNKTLKKCHSNRINSKKKINKRNCSSTNLSRLSTNVNNQTLDIKDNLNEIFFQIKNIIHDFNENEFPLSKEKKIFIEKINLLEKGINKKIFNIQNKYENIIDKKNKKIIKLEKENEELKQKVKKIKEITK